MKFCYNWPSRFSGDVAKLSYYENPGPKVKESPLPLVLTNLQELIKTTLITIFRLKSSKLSM